MPVQANIMVQNVATVAWDGTAAFSFDMLKYTRFGWSFEVTTTLTADTVFKFQQADGTAADPCVAGTFEDIDEVATCDSTGEAGLARITLPSGTVAGTICGGTIPCFQKRHIRLAVVSGSTANVKAVMLRQGPKM